MAEIYGNTGLPHWADLLGGLPFEHQASQLRTSAAAGAASLRRVLGPATAAPAPAYAMQPPAAPEFPELQPDSPQYRNTRYEPAGLDALAAKRAGQHLQDPTLGPGRHEEGVWRAADEITATWGDDF
jgi:hypothetical protein